MDTPPPGTHILTSTKHQNELVMDQYNNPALSSGDESSLPPTKIQRKYWCKICPNITTNPREHLRHLQNDHHLKVKIVECPKCVYACQYRQKLYRHLRLIHKIPEGQSQQLLIKTTGTNASNNFNDTNNTLNTDNKSVININTINNGLDSYGDLLASASQFWQQQLAAAAAAATTSNAIDDSPLTSSDYSPATPDYTGLPSPQYPAPSQCTGSQDEYPDNDEDYQEEPLNLSYPEEVKELIRSLTQTFQQQLEQQMIGLSERNE